MDEQTSTVWLSFNRDGYRTYVLSSQDSGATWSQPADITDDVMLPNWTHYVVGPGRGIQMRSGRLAIPAGHRDSTRTDWIFSHSHMIYSDDHGAAWHVGGSLQGGSNECELVETQEGALYMTVRSANRRVLKRLCA